MIEIDHLVKRYGDIKAVDDISFTVHDGEILGFLGPIGAGKSTTMNILTGYISATSGSVKINGYDILEQPAEAKACIGYLPEQPPLYTDMTVMEYLHFVADLNGVDKKEQPAHLAEILRMVRITDVAHRLIGNLSKGYRQRVGIAQALIGHPDVLILDEPTVGLDPKQIIEIRNTIRELGKKHTVILSSHILSEVSETCDRVVIINRGKIVAEGGLDQLTRQASQRNFRLLVKGPGKEVLQKIRLLPGIADATLVREDGELATVDYENVPGKDSRVQVFYEMARNAWPILETRSIDPTLEDIFLEVTGNASFAAETSGGVRS